jgi:hypothetical protein
LTTISKDIHTDSQLQTRKYRKAAVLGRVLLTYDQDHWNAQHAGEEPIQLPMDLTFDIELKKNMPDEGEEAA